ncbi:MAG: exo-alpha-sialidase [Planctomyces sp.]|nr:exo-alpha-sialidase [Planctomyces sp.]
MPLRTNLLLAVVFASTVAARAADPAPGVLSSQFIYETAPYPECHASTIVETPGGMVAAWFGGTEEKHPDVGIWVSKLGSDGWSTPVEVADGVQHSTLRYPCWNPVLQQIEAGPLLLFYKVGPNPDDWWGMLTVSEDGGDTWSWPRRLPHTIDGPVRNKAITLPDGLLLCGSSTEHDGWRVHFEITRDQGRTWDRIGPINDGREWNAIQPTILTHKDGSLQALCRTQEGWVASTRSTDQGRTWSPLAATVLPNPNSGIDAVTLADGRHLLVYNHTLRRAGRPHSRELLNVAISDDGESWRAAAILENQRGEYSYPAVIQANDGRVHITYTWDRKKIRHVVVNPELLELREMPDGRWPGLPQAGVADQ